MRTLFNPFITLAAGTIAMAPMVVGPARADIATVGYLHGYITEKWSITIDHSDANSNIISLRRLMQTIDSANQKLNGTATSYATSAEYNKSNIASANMTKWAVDNLIEKQEQEILADSFYFKLVASDAAPKIIIRANGTFTMDWGDGTVDTVTITENYHTFEHEYDVDTYFWEYPEIRLSGKATEYAYADTDSVIEFYMQTVESIRGCLGCVFPTLDDDSQPSFFNTFSGSYIKTIPETLFNGIHGQPNHMMFFGTFSSCTELTEIPENLFSMIQTPISSLFENTFTDCHSLKTIPEKLFSSLQGAPTESLFAGTFEGCTSLKTVPKNLFSGIQGPVKEWLFYRTFAGCINLESIPSGLFSGIKAHEDNSAQRAFQETFMNCKSLTGIPSGLFSSELGTASPYYGDYMFVRTFANCTNLTGESAKIGDKYLYEIWTTSRAASPQTYQNATGLSDYKNIPSHWK